jgi:hypothetical protein
MEASGLGGPTMGLVLVPGLLASGVGALIFVGQDRMTGLGTFSLAIPHLAALQPARPSHPDNEPPLSLGVMSADSGLGRA